MSMVHRFVLGLALASMACSGEGDPTGSGSLQLSHSSTAPGQTGSTPGQSGQTPANGALPPGQAGTTPGQGGMPGADLCVGVSCDDSNPCTVDSCDPATGCAHANAADGTVVDATPTSCGVGPCRSTGQTVCSNGAAVDSCRASVGAASDATCDGVDDDCDGSIDEDYAPVATACGAGACASMGSTTCGGGVVRDSCTAGGAAASDGTCNGIDDDCDGAVDEDFVPASTSCGACAAAGSTSCVAGSVVDSCSPGAAATSDATCNGLDDDCDGAVDEDFARISTSCGVGACGATGSTACVGGAVVDSCSPGAAAASDATCNGVDDDCSGAADEDYAAVATACGAGACAATGHTSCVGGAVVDSCTAGGAAASDASCNGIDDDCDGAVDEDFAPAATSCGTGACVAAGSTSCVGGVVVDSCRPGAAPCEAPTVIFTTTPPATTSATNVEFHWTYTGSPTTVRFVTSNGYDSGIRDSLNTGFGYSGLVPGTYTFTVTAFNAVGSGSASFTWTVTPPPVGGGRIVGYSSYYGLQTVGLDGSATPLNSMNAQVAQWSPDGRYIAYRQNYPWELWVQRADGSDQRKLSGALAINTFSWSPDSSTLVFEVNASGYLDLWSVNVDGTNLRNLTQTTNRSEAQATFTPGGRIVYQNTADSWSIWTMDADGGNKARLIVAGADVILGRPMFSPDGRFLYAVNFQGVLLRFNADGTGRTAISNGPVSFTEYALSPDGTRVSFLRNNQVWVIDHADGAATVRQLSTQSSGNAAAYQITTWSPDGASIVFDCNAVYGQGVRLCRVDANAPAPVAATFVGSTDCQFPQWSGYNPPRGG